MADYIDCFINIIKGTFSLQTFIEDSSVDGPSLFIVCLGIYSIDVLAELIRLDVPVNVLIKLKTSNHDDQPRGSYADFWDNVDKSKPLSRFKEVAVIDVPLERLHTDECLRKYIEQVSTEIAWLLYDSDELVRQHRQYLNDMKVYEIAIQNADANVKDYPVYFDYFANMNEDQISVEHILDAMACQAAELSVTSAEDRPIVISASALNVEGILDDIVLSDKSAEDQDIISTTSDIENPKPMCFVFEDNVTVVEKQDKLMHEFRDVTATQLGRYQFCLQALTKAWSLQRFNEQTDKAAAEFPDQSVEFVLNTLASLGILPNFPVEASLEIIIQRVLQLIKQPTVDHFVELFGASTLQQKLAECLQSYDTVEQLYLPTTNSVLVRFACVQTEDGLVRSSTEHSLITPICLRDFVEFNVNDEDVETKPQDTKIQPTNACADNTIINGLPGSAPDTSDPLFIASTTFLVNRSLKKHGNDTFEAAVEEGSSDVIDRQPIQTKKGKKDKPQTPLPDAEITKPVGKEDKNAKKKTNKSRQNSRMSTVSTPSLPESVVPQTFRHTGYDIGDRRRQFNRQQVVFRSVALTIRYTCDDWLYGPKHVWLTATTEHGADIIAGQAIGAGAIEHVLCRQPDGVHLVFEVVDGQSLLLHIGRRNGLLVQTVPLNQTEYRVDQTWTANSPLSDGEQRRTMFSNGWVAVYYASGHIRVITASGMVVQTAGAEEFLTTESPIVSTENMRLYSKKRKSSAEQSTELKPFKHEYLLKELLATVPELADMAYRLTASDGTVYLVRNGAIVSQLKSLWSTEIIDYQRDERLWRREDGFKINFARDSTRCIYADGTQIWSSVSYRDLYVSDDDETVRDDGTDNSDAESNAEVSADAEADTSADVDADTEPDASCRGVCFSVVTRSFRMQHDAYEEVVFHNEAKPRLEFSMRDVWYTPVAMCAKLSESDTLECDLRGVRLTMQQCSEHNRRCELRIGFGADESEPMLQFEGLTIDRLGGLELVRGERRSSSCARCDSSDSSVMRPRDFIVKRDRGGYEILPAAAVEQAIVAAEQTAVTVELDESSVTILDAMQVAQKSRLVPGVEGDTLLRDAYNVKRCQPDLNVDALIRQKLAPKIGIRLFRRVKCAVAQSTGPLNSTVSELCKAAEK